MKLAISFLLAAGGCLCLPVGIAPDESGPATPDQSDLPDPDATDPSAPDETAPTRVSGRLRLLPEGPTRSILEKELNDSVFLPQVASRLDGPSDVVIVGDLSALEGDRIDAFEFTTDELLYVTFTLSFRANAEDIPTDLDVAIHDFVASTCAPKNAGDTTFAACFGSTANPEVGRFEVSSTFVVAVTAASGAAAYQLDMSVTPSTNPTTSSKAADATLRPLWREVDRRSAPAPSDVGSAPGEVLIAFDAAIDLAMRDRILDTHGLRLLDCSPSGAVRAECTRHAAAAHVTRDACDVIPRLRGVEGVRIAEHNSIRRISRTPNDRFFNLQWHYRMVNLPQAWDLTVGAEDVVVAVIDTGVVSAHPDLAERLLPGFDFIDDIALARDGDGRDPDPEDPGDGLGRDGFSSFHGTHVAGIIGAATNNRRGVAGVTWETKIMPLRVFSAAGGAAFDTAEAIRYAAGLPNVSGWLPERPAHVINMSFSSPTGSQVEREAIQAALDAGIVLTGASGNTGTSEERFPAALPAVIGVGAVNIQAERAPYSNFGPSVSLTAPGGVNAEDLNGDGFPDGVFSTSARDFTSAINLRYETSTGTSMAAAHVAGVAALVIAANPGLTGSEVREILELTATDLGPEGRDDEFGFGLVDAAAAVRESFSRAGVSVDATPVLSVVPSALDFGTTQELLAARIFNAGGGRVTVSSVTVTEMAGSGWLRASLRGSTVEGTNADEVLVAVERDGQSEGILQGVVTLTGDDGQESAIRVLAIVGSVEPVSETVTVTVLDAETRTPVAETTTNAAAGYAFEFTNVPPGTYFVGAGTDRDGDGVICEIGDLCGTWATSIDIRRVVLAPGTQVVDLDFAVAPRLLREVQENAD